MERFSLVKNIFLNNLRKTKKNPNWNLKSKIWFFGGSTIWGTSVSDENTIPSLSSDLNHDFQPVNVGENLYVSGQSLNRLIENIDNINETIPLFVRTIQIFFNLFTDKYIYLSKLYKQE